jgi:hypothetical protein
MPHPAVKQLPQPLAVLASEIAMLRQDISAATLPSWWSSSWTFLFKWEAMKQNLKKVFEIMNSPGPFHLLDVTYPCNSI